MEPLVTLDITTLTLGELASAERASGLSYQEMMRGTFSRLLLAMYVHELRNSDEPRWQETERLRGGIGGLKSKWICGPVGAMSSDAV